MQYVSICTLVTAWITFGWTCENLSTTPETPKSGEVELQIAPIEAVAAIASIASGQLGMYPTTRSPSSIPNFLKLAEYFCTASRS